MTEETKAICPACGKVIKIDLKFCTNCGAKLNGFDEIKTISADPSQDEIVETKEKTSLIKGWEVSTDRIDKYKKMLSVDDVGDPIITSKCKFDNENGLLVVSNNGFAWRIQVGFGTTGGMYKHGKSKWLRWHDVANIIPKKPGVILIELKIRKKGSLILDGKGNPKTKKWKLTLQQNKAEEKIHFRQRQQDFNKIMAEIYNQNKVEINPATSDSRM
ncbi:MAG: zinc ribbon domain-containing protein [Promethearchaeota archaeon]